MVDLQWVTLGRSAVRFFPVWFIVTGFNLRRSRWSSFQQKDPIMQFSKSQVQESRELVKTCLETHLRDSEWIRISFLLVFKSVNYFRIGDAFTWIKMPEYERVPHAQGPSGPVHSPSDPFSRGNQQFQLLAFASGTLCISSQMQIL